MRFTRQFPVYYCCVLVVPDKINQCLWIIAGECGRCLSAAESAGLFSGAVQRSGDLNDRQKICPGPLIQDQSDHVKVLSRPWLWVFGLNTWVLWSLICGGSIVVVVGMKTLSCPKLSFHWETEEANMLRARCWTLSLLPLSLNCIRLLIILWTGLRPYFNLSWRAGEIREGECCFGPPDLSRALQCADFCFAIALVPAVLTLTDSLPFQQSCTHVCIDIHTESNELGSVAKETN